MTKPPATPQDSPQQQEPVVSMSKRLADECLRDVLENGVVSGLWHLPKLEQASLRCTLQQHFLTLLHNAAALRQPRQVSAEAEAQVWGLVASYCEMQAREFKDGTDFHKGIVYSLKCVAETCRAAASPASTAKEE